MTERPAIAHRKVIFKGGRPGTGFQRRLLGFAPIGDPFPRPTQSWIDPALGLASCRVCGHRISAFDRARPRSNRQPPEIARVTIDRDPRFPYPLMGLRRPSLQLLCAANCLNPPGTPLIAEMLLRVRRPYSVLMRLAPGLPNRFRSDRHPV